MVVLAFPRFAFVIQSPVWDPMTFRYLCKTIITFIKIFYCIPKIFQGPLLSFAHAFVA